MKISKMIQSSTTMPFLGTVLLMTMTVSTSNALPFSEGIGPAKPAQDDDSKPPSLLRKSKDQAHRSLDYGTACERAMTKTIQTNYGCTEYGIMDFIHQLDVWLKQENCFTPAKNMLAMVMNVGGPEMVEAELESRCHSYWYNPRQVGGHLNTVGAPVNFDTFIPGGTNSDIKAFFDGKTDWNEKPLTDADRNVIRNNYAMSMDYIYKLPDEVNNPGVQNFESCELSSYMCCWPQDGVDEAKQYEDTDVCYVENPDLGQFEVYDEEAEGKVHCHGLNWSRSPVDSNKILAGNALFYVSIYDHMHQRGYVRNIGGAPMCGCTEKMPTVDRAGCTEFQVQQKLNFEMTYTSFNMRLVDAKPTFTYSDCGTAHNAYATANPGKGTLTIQTNDLWSDYQVKWAAGRARPEEIAMYEGKIEMFNRKVVSKDMCDSVLAEMGLDEPDGPPEGERAIDPDSLTPGNTDDGISKQSWIVGSVVIVVFLAIMLSIVMYMGFKNQWSWWKKVCGGKQEQADEVVNKEVEGGDDDANQANEKTYDA